MPFGAPRPEPYEFPVSLKRRGRVAGTFEGRGEEEEGALVSGAERGRFAEGADGARRVARAVACAAECELRVEIFRREGDGPLHRPQGARVVAAHGAYDGQEYQRVGRGAHARVEDFRVGPQVRGGEFGDFGGGPCQRLRVGRPLEVEGGEGAP